MPGTLDTTATQTLAVTTSLQQRDGTQLNVSTTNQQYNLGNFVQNVSILPYIPSKTIRFTAYGLKPSTRVWAYFSNVPVSAWCAPITDSVNYSTDSIANSQLTSVKGTALYTDTNGFIDGIFTIPPNTFQSQQNIFQLLDISDLSQGKNAITTEADATYYGSTLSVAQGSSILNTRQATVSSSQVTQTQTVQGLGVAQNITQQYIPDPVGGGGGGSGCGCGSCFIGNSLVMLENGAEIPIKDIKIGDRVYNYNYTKINTVMYVERTEGKMFDYLFSPSSSEPFATGNHPVYINGVLSSVDPEQNYNWYPFLSKTKKIDSFKSKRITDEIVYNLWVDGDNTYTVNGLGTTSIIGDGGLLRICIDQGLIKEEEVSEIIYQFTNKDKYTSYGIFVVNKYLKSKNKFINKILVNKILRKKTITRFIFDGLIKFFGYIILFKELLKTNNKKIIPETI